MKLIESMRNSLLVALSIFFSGHTSPAIGHTSRAPDVTNAPVSAVQKAILTTYDKALKRASNKFEAELSRRIPNYQALKSIFERGAFGESILLRSETAALLITRSNIDGSVMTSEISYEKQLELTKIATHWFDKTGRGYWAIILAAQEQTKRADAVANQWFARALSAGFVEKELREVPALLLQAGQAWIAADFPVLTPELLQLGRRSSAGFAAAEMFPLTLMPAEMLWVNAMERLCMDANQLEDAQLRNQRVSQCIRAKKLLIAQASRRLNEYGVAEIPPIRENSDLDDQLFAPFKALECQLVDEQTFVERLTIAVENIENKSLGIYFKAA